MHVALGHLAAEVCSMHVGATFHHCATCRRLLSITVRCCWRLLVLLCFRLKKRGFSGELVRCLLGLKCHKLSRCL